MGRSKAVSMTKELEDLIYHAYHDLHISTTNIAKKKNLGVGTVINVLEKRGVTLRGRRGRVNW